MPTKRDIERAREIAHRYGIGEGVLRLTEAIALALERERREVAEECREMVDCADTRKRIAREFGLEGK